MTIQFFKQQTFYKEFMREETPLQLEYFIRFPDTDGPWSEDPTAQSVKTRAGHIIREKPSENGL